MHMNLITTRNLFKVYQVAQVVAGLVYILNGYPSSNVQDKVHQERLRDTKVNFSHLEYLDAFLFLIFINKQERILMIEVRSPFENVILNNPKHIEFLILSIRYFP